MRRPVFGITLTALAIALGGCGLFGGDDTAVILEEIPETTEEPQEFPTPAAELIPVLATKTDLVRPTDPDERLRAIKSGRPDPFASLLTPSKPSTDLKTIKPQFPAVPPGTKPGSSKPANSKPVAVLPPLPTADTAKAVQVTGIVTVGSEPQAIVLAPNEKVSRTVKVGDRLARGQVLVKRIDLSNRAEPVLILEEAGIEVSLGIGRPG